MLPVLWSNVLFFFLMCLAHLEYISTGESVRGRPAESHHLPSECCTPQCQQWDYRTCRHRNSWGKICFLALFALVMAQCKCFSPQCFVDVNYFVPTSSCSSEFLCTTASYVPCERLFYTAGAIAWKKCNKLNFKTKAGGNEQFLRRVLIYLLQFTNRFDLNQEA